MSDETPTEAGADERLDVIFQPREAEEIRETFMRELGQQLRAGESFEIDGEMDAERLVVRVRLADQEREEVLTLEAGHEVDDKDIEAGRTLVDARAHAVEFLFAFVHDYLRDDRWPRPHHDWKEYTFRGVKVYLRGTVVNERLEAMADEWLAKADSNLPE